ncbi:MAG: IS110 family transposase, partial [Anaerolineales bacterium]|nr:IS110 family transposase [Anaerolineales bacterium]
MNTSLTPTFVGIDVSKDSLEIAIHGQPGSWQIAN